MKSELELILELLQKSPLDYPGRENFLRKRENLGAAVTLLFCGENFNTAQILLTERSHEVFTHKGQVAFPGGVIESQDEKNPAKTALRECQEEVGLEPSSIQLIGELPSFPTVTGNFEVVPVLGLWKESIPPQLALQTSEVAIAEWVSVEALIATRFYERHFFQGNWIQTPVFTWGNRKMWGLSAWIFDLVALRYDTIDQNKASK